MLLSIQLKLSDLNLSIIVIIEDRKKLDLNLVWFCWRKDPRLLEDATQNLLFSPITESTVTGHSIAMFVTYAWTNVFRENTSVERTQDTMSAAFVWRLAFSSSSNWRPHEISSANSYDPKDLCWTWMATLGEI